MMGSVFHLERETEKAELLGVFKLISQELGWQPGEWLDTSPATAHYIAVNVGEELAGGLQIVLPSVQGELPYVGVWPEVILSAPCRTAHVTILALSQKYRGKQGLFWSLCIEMWRFCTEQGMDTLVLEATPSMMERYRKLKWPLESIGDLRLHWGEECYLCQMDLRTAAGAMLIQAQRSPSYRTLIGKAARSIEEIV